MEVTWEKVPESWGPGWRHGAVRALWIMRLGKRLEPMAGGGRRWGAWDLLGVDSALEAGRPLAFPLLGQK